jgi:hypothetical protein
MAQSAVNVVVFNPPPVPDGDAPMIITTVIKNNDTVNGAS